MSIGATIKALLGALKAEEAGATPLCEAFAALTKRGAKTDSVSELIEVIRWIGLS